MKKTYRVGPVPYGQYKPGETFSASLDPEKEARALARGSLKVVTEKANEGAKGKGNDG